MSEHPSRKLTVKSPF